MTGSLKAVKLQSFFLPFVHHPSFDEGACPHNVGPTLLRGLLGVRRDIICHFLRSDCIACDLSHTNINQVFHVFVN